MYYEINVTLNGRHFFATAKWSIIDTLHLKDVLKVVTEKFPKSEGYGITVWLKTESGEEIDKSEILG